MNPRAKGFKDWIAGMSPEQLAEHNSKAGQKGGVVRALKLSKKRRHEIAVMGGRANQARLKALDSLKSKTPSRNECI